MLRQGGSTGNWFIVPVEVLVGSLPLVDVRATLSLGDTWNHEVGYGGTVDCRSGSAARSAPDTS